MCNDRFKFRAYLKDTQKMVTTIFYDSTYGWQASDGSVQYTFPSEYAALMQCTGLKDKNDKLIFEGDIVHVDEKGQGWYIEFGSFGDCAYYAINGINSCRQLEVDCGIVGFSIRGDDMTEAVVIGNIYENPELMEQE